MKKNDYNIFRILSEWYWNFCFIHHTNLDLHLRTVYLIYFKNFTARLCQPDLILNYTAVFVHE